MLRLPVVIAAAVGLLFASASAQSALLFIANLLNSNEPPATFNPPTNQDGSPRNSFGTATFVLNDAQTELRFTATINGIDVNGLQTPTFAGDNLTAAHIHAGTGATPTFGVVWGFFGAPQNDIAPNDRTITPFATGLGGTFTGKWDVNEGNPIGTTTLTNQLANIFAGRSYINFHTTQNTGGEIRGTLVLVGPTIPEPSSIALLGIAAVGLFAVRARRRAPKSAAA